MIDMHQTIVTGIGTGSRGCLWRATCTIAINGEGQDFDATSRSGAPYALARELVTAGLPDQPVRVTSDAMSGTEIRRLPGHASYASLHRMAEFTMAEGGKTRLLRVRWSAFDRTRAEGASGYLPTGPSHSSHLAAIPPASYGVL